MKRHRKKTDTQKVSERATDSRKGNRTGTCEGGAVPGGSTGVRAILRPIPHGAFREVRQWRPVHFGGGGGGSGQDNPRDRSPARLGMSSVPQVSPSPLQTPIHPHVHARLQGAQNPTRHKKARKHARTHTHTHTHTHTQISACHARTYTHTLSPDSNTPILRRMRARDHTCACACARPLIHLGAACTAVHRIISLRRHAPSVSGSSWTSTNGQSLQQGSRHDPTQEQAVCD